MFERYSESARRALFFSRYAVTQLGGARIEPEHLVLGVLQGTPDAVLRFTRGSETAETLRAQLEAVSTVDDKVGTSVEVPFSPDSVAAIERTPIEADALENPWIRPEHLVLGVMVATFGPAMCVLRDAGVDADAIREYLRGAADDRSDRPATVHGPPAGSISRHWTGVVKPGLADRYVDHLRRETFPLLAHLPGFVTVSILRREIEDGTEFQVVTVWESLDAIRAFTGEDVTAAVVPPEAQALLLRYDERAVHFEIVQ